MLIGPCSKHGQRVSRIIRFYSILSRETNRVTAGSNCHERRALVGSISCFRTGRTKRLANRWHPHCFSGASNGGGMVDL